MKLGEAKQRLVQVKRYLSESEITLSRGPLSMLGDTLDQCSTLLQEEQVLRSQVAHTEATTDIGGESIRKVIEALEVLEHKITYLELVSVRNDLDASQSDPVFKQLESYRKTRDTLRLSLEKCLWEFELVE